MVHTLNLEALGQPLLPGRRFGEHLFGAPLNSGHG